MIAANKLVNVRRRVNRARKFPTNTCGASRHVHLMADWISGPQHGFAGAKFHPEDAEHIAGSLYSVLESLWKARTRLAALEPPPAAPEGLPEALDLMDDQS